MRSADFSVSDQKDLFRYEKLALKKKLGNKILTSSRNFINCNMNAQKKIKRKEMAGKKDQLCDRIQN